MPRERNTMYNKSPNGCLNKVTGRQLEVSFAFSSGAVTSKLAQVPVRALQSDVGVYQREILRLLCIRLIQTALQRLSAYHTGR